MAGAVEVRAVLEAVVIVVHGVVTHALARARATVHRRAARAATPTIAVPTVHPAVRPLVPALRRRLPAPRAEQADHDVFLSAFSPEGTFTYAPSLTRFTLRYLLEVTEGSVPAADESAVVEGELLASDYLETRGISHQPLSVSAVCLQDVKVKPRR